MDKDDLIIEEYKQLSSEILSLTKINYSILLALISITGTIIGFVVAKELMLGSKLLLLLSTSVLVALGFKIICTNRGGLWKKSYYISIFIEKEFGYVGWQTYVSNSREERDKKESKNHNSSFFHRLFIYFNETHEFAVVVLLHVIPSLFSTKCIIESLSISSGMLDGNFYFFYMFNYQVCLPCFIFFNKVILLLVVVWTFFIVFLLYTYRLEKKYRGGGEISKKWKEYWLARKLSSGILY
jgi:hypothetical protein